MAEHYVVVIDASVQNKEQLFTRFTDTIYLGESGIPGWDQFCDLLYLRLAESDIAVDVVNQDLSGLSEQDRTTYFKALSDSQDEAPGKLRLV